MDTSKFVIKLSVDDFYTNYTQTLRELYSDSFISQHNLQPTTQNSFQRVMSKRAGISLDKREDKSYTEEDLAAIVKDTNDKYEEYANGSYSDSVKKRGQTRYILMATVLQETFRRLGYKQLAEQFKYVQQQEKTTEDNIIKAYHDAESAETEDTEVKNNVSLLKESLETINKKIQGYENRTLSDKEREIVEKLTTTLSETIDSAKRCATGKNNVTELTTLIADGENVLQKLKKLAEQKNMSKEDTNKAILESMRAALPEDPAEEDKVISCEDTYAVISKAVALIPGVIQELNNLKDDYRILWQQNQEYAKTLEENKKQQALPDNEDELVLLAKQVINKISDRGKLKDIAMVLMMKAM